MRIVADENCDRILVAELRSAGFDVVWVRDLAPGIGDVEIYGIAAADNRVLLTNDRGFGLMAERSGSRRPPAIILMRLDRLRPVARTAATLRTLAGLGESLLGCFTVIEPHQVRSRPLKD
jgi:predicted nuclease of predicted toxin-antitoxin system